MGYTASYSKNRYVGISHCGSTGVGSGTCYEFRAACAGKKCSNNRLWGIWPHYAACSANASPCNRQTTMPKATGRHGGCNQVFLVGPCSSTRSGEQEGSIISCGPNSNIKNNPVINLETGTKLQSCSTSGVYRVCSVNMAWADAIFGAADLSSPHFMGRVVVSKNL